MATSGAPAAQPGEPLAYQLNVETNPSIWGMAVLIPLSLYICSKPGIGLGPVLITRLLVIMSMNFVQKEAVMAFPCWFLLAYQLVLQGALVGAYNFSRMKVGKWSDLCKWLLYLTPFWVAQLITSLHAFKATSVSTVQIIRSVLPLMSFAMEKTLYGSPKTVSSALIASMVLVIAGTTLYGYSSASVTAAALMWIMTNSVFTVVATVFRSKFMKDKDFTVSLPAAMWSVSTAAVPCICVCAVLSGETRQWPAVLAETPPTAWFFATISGLVAGCFSFLQFRCQRIVSGTSDLMFQNFVKVFIIILGIVAFGDKFDMESLMGGVIALGGCAWYGRLRIRKEVAEGSKEPASAANTSDLNAPLLKEAPQASRSKVDVNGNGRGHSGPDLDEEQQRSERDLDKQ